MRTRVLDLDGSVASQPSIAALVAAGGADVVPARDLASHLRIVATRRAMAEVVERMGPLDADRPELVFYGSGDFHHVTYGLLQRLGGPVTVVHFDNHPDWIRFPATLNCGSWVSRALREGVCARVLTIGPCSDDLANPEIKMADLPLIRDGRLALYAWNGLKTRLWGPAIQASGVRSEGDRLIWRDFSAMDFDILADELLAELAGERIWITLDKDVLTPSEAVTNWDQGKMSLDQVLGLIQRMAQIATVAGMDVCGDYSKPRFNDPFRAFLSWSDRAAKTAPVQAELAINDASNSRIIETMRPIFSKNKNDIANVPFVAKAGLA